MSDGVTEGTEVSTGAEVSTGGVTEGTEVSLVTAVSMVAVTDVSRVGVTDGTVTTTTIPDDEVGAGSVVQS